MTKGGKRENAGRPKGSVGETQKIAIKLKQIMAEKLKQRFGPIIDAQLDSAFGIQTEHYDRKTNNLYYKEPGPNVNAFRTIIEQIIGKPKESLEISGGDEPVKLDIRIKESLNKIYKNEKSI